MVEDVKWDMVPLGLVAEFHTGWTPPSGDDRYYGGTHKWANISDVGTRHLYDTERTISDFALEKQPGARLALPGDLLFPFKLSIGAVSFACEEMYTNEAIAVFSPNEKIDLRFAYYAFPYFLLKNAGVNIYGAPLLNSTLIKQARVPSPPLETQQRIADYLDRETAEIDAAVADLDKYVELLEKRKWQQLNEILENSHHSRVRLSVAAKMKTGTTPSTLIENEEGVPWLKPDGLGVQSTGQRIDFEMLGESLLSPGGTTYVCGIGATIGKVGYSEEPSITNQQITALTPVLNIIPKLFYYSVLTLTDWLRRTAPGSTLPILNNTRLGTYSVRIPDLDVQQTVLAEMESLFHETDQIIAESTKLRDLLVKRRAVMITEVVTGRKQV